jgi:antitoxin ParD1/3/4
MREADKILKAFRTYLTIKDPKQVVISDLPFREGQRVEVVVLARDEADTARIQELKDLLKATQSLPQAQALSEEDIAREIEAYRSGQ